MRRLATEEATCIAVRPHNNIQHRFLKNSSRSATRSRKADENAAAQKDVTNLNQKILVQAASLKELKAQKKTLQQQTGVKARRIGTAAKGKLMPSIATAQSLDEDPPTADFAELYTAMRQQAASTSTQPHMNASSYSHLSHLTLDRELDPDYQGFPSSTAPPSFHHNDYSGFHL